MKHIIIFIFAFVSSIHGRVTPKNFPHCKRSDPDISMCFLRALEAFRPQILQGVPELKIPAFQPFRLSTLKVDKTLKNLQIKVEIRNGIGYDVHNYKIEGLKITPGSENKKYEGAVKISLPEVRVTADYEMEILKILNFQERDSRGKFEGSFTNITGVAKGNAKTVTKDKVKYLEVEDMEVEIIFGGGHVDIKDSNGRSSVKTVAALFNTNPQSLLDELSPIIEETVAIVAKSILNKVLARVPLHEIIEDE